MLLRFVFVVVLAFCFVPVYAAGPHGIQPGQPLTDTGAVIINDTVAQALADTGAGFVRINFRLGPYSSDTAEWYAIYDGIVDRLRSRGLEIIALMTNEAWPGGGWSENAYETTGGNGWNSYLNNWCNFFLRAATHWKGKIKYWELWNEPDCLAVIYPSNYGALLANAYDLVHTNNIPVEIISGGVCGGYGKYGADYIKSTYDVSINHTGWFTQIKNKWGTYPLDHIGFHIYPNCDRALDVNWLSNYFEDVHNAYVQYEGAGTQKKMFLTEIGWQTAGTNCHVANEAVQASNLTAAYKTANSKPYIKNVTWFFLKDEPAANLYFGVFRSTGLNESDKKQSWTNLKTACTYEGRWTLGGAVNQPILDYFNAKGHAQMGNPCNIGTSALVYNWIYGPVQHYDGGQLGRMIVCDSSDGKAYAVRGNFLPVFQANHSILEFPMGDEFHTGTVDKQRFECGYVTWSESEGAKITPYENKIIVDNMDAGFTASSNWTTAPAAGAYGSNVQRRRGTINNSEPAVWNLSVPKAGYYNIFVRYPTIVGATAAAVYEIVHADGTSNVIMSQMERTARWNHLGCYRFNVGSATVRLSSQSPETDWVTADAVRIVGPVDVLDTTAPSRPVLIDDGTFTGDPTSLHCSWIAIDPQSEIEEYEYYVGTFPKGSDVVPPTRIGPVNQVWVRGLSLEPGKTYYFTAKAKNSAGLWSTEGVSNGIRYDVSQPVDTISQALALPDTSSVLLKNKAVSAMFSGLFYLEELNRSAGIGVNWNSSVYEGGFFDITGILQTVAGERRLTAGCVTPVEP